ncbi:S8 family peptidase [Aliikangiella sp. IMCC44359]|uniref:S8 family peptidase n=1 Tax=Aliikangiella sp. IMCC44359 TaxID=3459125 RepID=UPI00403B24A6
MKLKKIVTSILLATGATCSYADIGNIATETNDPHAQSASMIQQGTGLIIKWKDQNGLTSTQAQNLRSSAQAMKSLSKSLGAKLSHHRFNAFNAQIVQTDKLYSAEELEKMAFELSQNPNVEYAEPNLLMQAFATVNDPSYGRQWHYSDSNVGIDIEPAWDTTKGQGVTVAVIDTGYVSHADLAANLVGGYDFISSSQVARDGNGRDSNAKDEGDWIESAWACGNPQPTNSSWHGTHVAGTIAAVSNNNKGVAGIAYESKVVPVRVLGRCGGTTADIADAMIWSAGGSVSGVPANQNPAKVLNLSLGGKGSCGQTSQNAINSARANGAVVVVAAGNSNGDVKSFTPANCDGVISVAASNKNGNRASYSNYGSLIDIAAPGGDGGTNVGVLSTLNSGQTTPASDNYAWYSGTSMAAPHVAGVAALMFSVNPNLTPSEVEQKLKESVRPFPGSSSCNTSNCGAGFLDAPGAVQAAGGTTPPPPPGGSVLKNGVPATGLSASQGKDVVYTMEVPRGATDIKFDISGGTGDADMYVKFGSAPTDSSYDCRPYKSGNTESCTGSQAGGTYHVRVKAYSAFSGVSLVGKYTDGGTPPPGNDPIDRTESVSVAQGEWSRFTQVLPAGYQDLKVSISGGTGDADLYVRKGTASTTSSYDCRPYKNGNTENCDFTNPGADTWHIDVRGYRAASGVTLNIKANPKK